MAMKKNVLRPLDWNGLSEELVQRAKVELHEDEESRKAGIRSLRLLLEENGSYQKWCTKDNDEFILMFLRARKFDVDKAFLLFKNHFKHHRNFPEVSDDFDFDIVRKTIKTNCWGLLPHRDSDGCAVLIFNSNNWNPREVSMLDTIKTVFGGIMHCLRYPSTQIAGLKVILDYGGASLKQIMAIHPKYFYLSAAAMQSFFPVRICAVHIVNENYAFSLGWTVIKQFISEKIKRRIYFHGRNVEALRDFFPPSMLPKDFGGELEPFNNDAWARLMEKNKNDITEYFNKIEQCNRQ